MTLEEAQGALHQRQGLHSLQQPPFYVFNYSKAKVLKAGNGDVTQSAPEIIPKHFYIEYKIVKH